MARFVFVIGAGASKEAGLPVGHELKQVIAKALDIRFDRGSLASGDREIADAMRVSSQDVNTCRAAALKIRDAMPLAISIDNFLDAHNGDKHIEMMGKLAITRTILEAEQKSLLRAEPAKRNPLDLSALTNTWYARFWQILTENCREADLEKRLKEVALVIFNYDRCIEVFLLKAFQQYYHVSPSEAERLLGCIAIYHPYGSIGALGRIEEGGVPFGGGVQAPQLLALSRGIKTFTEGTDEAASDIVHIRFLVEGAHALIFLGFAYHRLNVNLLAPIPVSARTPRSGFIVGSALGFSEADVQAVAEDLEQRTGRQRVYLRQLTCRQIFDEYSRTISLT